VVSNIRVLSSSTVRADVTLKVGSITQRVTVVGRSPLVQTDSTHISGSVTTRQLADLPTQLQTIDAFMSLAPGVQALPGGDNNNPPIGGGTHWGSVNFTLNGVGANQSGNSGGVDVQGVGMLVLPPPASIQELKIQSSDMSAKYKGESNVNIVIKNGTNQFHGTAYDYVQNTSLNANQFLLNAEGLPRPAEHLNQFGGNVGGPIKRDKAFFFFDYSGYRHQDSAVAQHIFPSMAERSGDFSALCTANGGVFNSSGVCSKAAEQLYDPYTGAPFQNNLIPSSMISSQSKALLQYLPAPTDASSPGLPNGKNNFFGLIPQTQNANSIDLRIDANPSSKDRLFTAPLARAAQVTIGAHNVIFVDGRPSFPIGFTKGPPPGSKTPSGGDAYEELKTNGTVFQLVGPPGGQRWDAQAKADLCQVMAASAKAGLLTAISIPQLQAFGPHDQKKEEKLRRVVEKYRNDPALGFWKAKDEPAWGKVSPAEVERYYRIVHQLDPHHPVWLTQAPRGTVEQLRAYNPGYDIGAIDIYPVSYPPGIHSLLPNKDLSMVGDYAKELQQITEGKKPFWMVLQICWSGVTKPGKTLRMPTFPQERYMAYQAIIDGARGLVFFGGNVPGCMEARDKALGWNWRFYDRVLKPVLNELNPDSLLFPALVAPDSDLHVKLEGSKKVEYLAREADGYLYLLAAMRPGPTVKVQFSGLPAGVTTGKVLYEPPRTVSVADGKFTDWFAPHDVHVYRFKLP
jgi:hypothetical protein